MKINLTQLPPIEILNHLGILHIKSETYKAICNAQSIVTGFSVDAITLFEKHYQDICKALIERGQDPNRGLKLYGKPVNYLPEQGDAP